MATQKTQGIEELKVFNEKAKEVSQYVEVRVRKILRARFQGQNFMVKILHLTKSSTQISNIWLIFWCDLPFAR